MIKIKKISKYLSGIAFHHELSCEGGVNILHNKNRIQEVKYLFTSLSLFRFVLLVPHLQMQIGGRGQTCKCKQLVGTIVSHRPPPPQHALQTSLPPPDHAPTQPAAPLPSPSSPSTFLATPHCIALSPGTGAHGKSQRREGEPGDFGCCYNQSSGWAQAHGLQFNPC